MHPSTNTTNIRQASSSSQSRAAQSDEDAARDLLVALKRNCYCAKDINGRIVMPCPGHQALVDDPHWLRRLQFERYHGLRWTQEWCVKGSAA